MKLISEHLGEIIVALAGVALLVLAVTAFRTDISAFFDSIVAKLTGIGNNVLDTMDSFNTEGMNPTNP